MSAVITVKNVGKCYTVDHLDHVSRYRTLRESLSRGAGAAWNWVRRRGGTRTRANFWALKDINFELQPGEVLGIIGRNGAGKSTLLKILSRITKPTTGEVELRGRVGSLLEVGTGFHPELTGRENIFLSGAILGMSRKEIERKFHEIVAFAEVEEFLDTPVKRYSSGMYVRLAFAVAAHLEPEILLVDEVLAVGDATYQKRCVDRMSRIARSGRSVMFVSHNMDLIPRLCSRAVRLERGQFAQSGPAAAVVAAYLKDLEAGCSANDISARSRVGDRRALFTHVWLIGADQRPRAVHPSGEDLTIRFRIRSHCQIPNAALAVNVVTLSGTTIHSGWTREAGFPVSLKEGIQEYQCQFTGVRLRPGQRMQVGLWLEAGSVVDCLADALTFEAIDGYRTDGYSTDQGQGVVLCEYEWSQPGDQADLSQGDECPSTCSPIFSS